MFINNGRDATEVKDENGKVVGHCGDSICCVCEKQMPVCWDTVCAGCGGTHCYEHSIAKDGHWYCQKCLDKQDYMETSSPSMTYKIGV